MFGLGKSSKERRGKRHKAERALFDRFLTNLRKGGDEVEKQTNFQVKGWEVTAENSSFQATMVFSNREDRVTIEVWKHFSYYPETKSFREPGYSVMTTLPGDLSLAFIIDLNCRFIGHHHCIFRGNSKQLILLWNTDNLVDLPFFFTLRETVLDQIKGAETIQQKDEINVRT